MAMNEHFEPAFSGELGSSGLPLDEKNSPGQVMKKSSDKNRRRLPLFNSEALPLLRRSERTNYATTYRQPKRFISLVVPAIMCGLVVITSIMLYFRLAAHMVRSQVYEASRGYGVQTDARWYFVFRVAAGPEVEDGRLVEFQYSNCGQEVIIGCWRRIKQQESPYRLSDEEMNQTYVRNVYSFVEARPEVICPPSLFIGAYSPVDKNCFSDYDWEPTSHDIIKD
uniref:Integral membrane protein 2 n=1 Tax=Haemonchus contortus TaxID=6289 RepID=A0A7I4YWR0_HAECO